MIAHVTHPTRSAWIIVGLLTFAALAAVASLLGDSATWDETAHLTSGYSYLRTGDFRLAPDHPPLAKLLAALPAALLQPNWDNQPVEAWNAGDVWAIAAHWLFEINDGQRLLVAGRCMVVLLLLATLLCTYSVSKRLFGERAGLLSLAIAALCPTMLAHGRLVTTDLPATLAFLTTILVYARLLETITVARIALAGLALSAAALTKFSWPLLLPALLAMTAVAVLRRDALRIILPRISRAQTGPRLIDSRAARCGLLASIAVAGAFLVVLAIWTCYGLRYSPFRTDPSGTARMISTPTAPQPPPANLADVWASVQTDNAGAPLGGMTPPIVRRARDRRLLPEAYLYGLAYTAKTSTARGSYLMGEFPVTGDWRYFPLAFAIKTPIATMLLILCGIAALALRRASPRDAILLVGLLVFGGLYATTTITSGLNIGHRHILPLYPILFILAGAAAAWTGSRTGRAIIAVLLAWLAVANLTAFPHYLSYFNESIGGPARGHLYLADSNIDWGQDLLRLRDFARRHPDEPIKLWYFGSAEPSYYVPGVERLAGNFTAPLSHIESGWYFFSVTHFLGVYRVWARPEFWDDERSRTVYAQQHRAFGSLPPSADEFQRHAAARQFVELRAGRLASRLRDHPPDARVGWSLLGFRLTRQEVEELTSPGP